MTIDEAIKFLGENIPDKKKRRTTRENMGET
jgi:hypothetical protein